MNDQMIPADAIRAWREKYRGCTGNNALEALDALLPTPPPPTLADMTPEERREYQWAQADVRGEDGTWLVLDSFYDEDRAHVVNRRGYNNLFQASLVTPRPDLPKMVWTGDQKPAPAPALPDGWRLADHKDNGHVIVTKTIPDDDGEVCFVAPSVGFLGYGCCFCDPDELTYLDQ